MRRKGLGFSQGEFAEMANLGQSLICRLERGEIVNPTADTINKLIAILEVPASRIYELCNQEYGEAAKKEAPFNIFPLLEAIVYSKVNTLTISDFNFLVTIQEGLMQPLTPDLIDQLMAAREKPEEDQKEEQAEKKE